ncbi:3-isopropylmalate dehydratase, small subunit [Halobacteroides halobius DSM 5150]|uniref:3-isopropylmalate dehydratase small subunit n=1 Tax=Halobacteroides halobius (strain ATCC 35273 / DSM 5150 / MD-1) TaxID=748449 RepID=L0K6U9_HALHC|nr:3-isopropylmalate dehydratase small subunit [Halobacteroides halobius]AGB40260.1 3-isopropylmalate dehydratase, small subunit [Halobacteroides halobius DSM 5150]
MDIQGKAWKYGDDIDTDVIIPARYLNTSQPEELAKHCLEDLDEDFVDKMEQGDLIVAQDNFGCGSSREHAPLAIKAAGVSCVIANSFARIFYRNSINIGLPILECPTAVEAIAEGDQIEVDVESGTIKNLTKAEEYQAEAFPEFMQEIMAKDGLVNYVKERINN